MRHAFILIGAVLTLGACETVDGFGQDVENTGQAIQGAVDE